MLRAFANNQGGTIAQEAKIFSLFPGATGFRPRPTQLFPASHCGSLFGTVASIRNHLLGLLAMATSSDPPPRGLLFLVALGSLLVLAGLTALGLGMSGRFLPHDEAFLGLTADQLCQVNACRIVHFMIHDRVSFGGALVAVGLLYLWLALVPLSAGQAWAWWTFFLSGLVGFASFFAYLGYGYLDTWHGVGSLVMLPCFLFGLVFSWRGLAGPKGIRCLISPAVHWSWTSTAGLGRACLLATAFGLFFGGLTILAVGMTCVFVPQDLAFLGVEVDELHHLNPRLVPLIAHDRAGFGGAVCCCGLTLFLSVWCGKPSRGLLLTLCLVGIAGFGTAIGVHPAVGYNDVVHLGPAVIGALVYLAGLALTFRAMAGDPPISKGVEHHSPGRGQAVSLPSLRDLGLDLVQIHRIPATGPPVS